MVEGRASLASMPAEERTQRRWVKCQWYAVLREAIECKVFTKAEFSPYKAWDERLFDDHEYRSKHPQHAEVTDLLNVAWEEIDDLDFDITFVWNCSPHWFKPYDRWMLTCRRRRDETAEHVVDHVDDFFPHPDDEPDLYYSP